MQVLWAGSVMEGQTVRVVGAMVAGFMNIHPDFDVMKN